MQRKIMNLYKDAKMNYRKCEHLVMAEHYHLALKIELAGIASIGSEEKIEWYHGMKVIVLNTVDDVLLIG